MNRRFEILIMPTLLLAAIALPIPLMADRLPDPIATHWALDGRPDGSLDPTVLWLVVTGVWIGLWAALMVRARKGGPLPEAVLVLALGGFLAALMAITVAANDGAASWREAAEVGIVEVLIAVAAGLLLGGAAVLLERGHGSGEPAREPGVATIGLGAGEPGRSAVVVRRGPGLVLDLRGGSCFAVTVDEPAPAAGLLNDLRRRHAPG